MKNTKPFTWADLKKAVNQIPDAQLKKKVVIWTDDENCYQVANVEILKEDHLNDGDDGCAPRSDLKDAIKEAKQTGDQDVYYLIHKKGTRILYAE